MNSEADDFNERRAAEREELGSLDAYRRHAIADLKLKTVVKESHVSPVTAMAFNQVDPECSNLVATIGGNQATVYDGMHMGGNVDIVTHFVNTRTEHSRSVLRDLHSCAWIAADLWTGHEYGDACLAVAGLDEGIHVISVAESRVIRLLQGRMSDDGRREFKDGAVISLAACRAVPRMLASLSRDGALCTWDVPAGICTSLSLSRGSLLAMHPGGDCLVTGGRRGALELWTIPEQLTGEPKRTPSAEPALELGSDGRQLSGGGHSEAIDGLVFLGVQRLASRSVDGVLCVWDWEERSLLTSWRIPSHGPGCGLSATSDGDFLCAGNARGTAFVFDACTGSRLVALASEKVQAPVAACAISDDCCYVMAAAGNGFVLRYEHQPPPWGETESEEEEGAVGNGAQKQPF
mmetsp:Transcript_2408/g.7216  ORF Transcript_2408/g.7216 Transcript_2408/m.7216 type:complete len:406 (-) Transcript_2408:1578-2795(-)